MLIVALSGLAGPMAGGSRAGADDEVSVTRLQRDIAANGAQIEQLGRDLDEAVATIRRLDGEIGAAQDQLGATRTQMEAVRAEVRQRAAALYVVGGHTDRTVFDLARLADAASAQQYGKLVGARDRRLFAQLTDTAQSLDTLARQLAADRDAADARRAQLQETRTQLAALLDRQRKLLAALAVIPVMGQPQVSAAQMTAWFVSTGNVARLSGGMSIATLIATFYEEGRDEGVRPDLAFVQSVLETGYFRGATDNNYAGLGACDSCAGEPSFPSPRDGIRAQIQHLKNYGDPDSRASGLAHPPQPNWYGADPAVAVHNFDTFFAKGRAQTWQAMGRGNWATDPNYSTKILSIYFRVVVYTADH